MSASGPRNARASVGSLDAVSSQTPSQKSRSLTVLLGSRTAESKTREASSNGRSSFIFANSMNRAKSFGGLGCPRLVTAFTAFRILKAPPIDPIVPLYYRYNWGGEDAYL